MSSMNNLRDDDVVAIAEPPSSVAWGAVIGGAFAAASVSLILLMLGSALGLSSISPWSHPETVATFTVTAAIWLIVMQWIASGLGGYLTGRMRTRWVGVHSEEVFFRDTTHGFLTWAVATVLTATLLASTASSIVTHTAAMAVPAMAGPGAPPPPPPHPGNPVDFLAYDIDGLFRPAVANANPPTPDTRMETTRILAMELKNGSMPDSDKAYLAQLVSAHTGLNNADAATRVDDVIARINATREKVKEDAEAARKTAMHVSLYIFLSMLIGAFIASAAAALGGRHRDEF